MANKKIGFIGFGLMGHGMAKHLVEKGFATTILGHKNRAPVEDPVKRGARVRGPWHTITQRVCL